MAKDIDSSRAEFPIFTRAIYLNSCSQGALSLRVRHALEEYISSWDNYGSPWEEIWIGRVERARRNFAALVGASSDEIAVVPSVSSGLHALVSAMNYNSGRDKVVLTDLEFPTVAFIWQAQQRRGARLQFVRSTPEGTIDLEELDRAIDERTLAVQITRVCYKTGYKLPVPDIARIAHAKGAMVILDDYQASGALPINVKQADVDVLVTGALKYLLGSQGIAFLYVRRDLIPILEPVDIGWFAHDKLITGFQQTAGELRMQGDASAFDLFQFQYAHDARRFEAGTPSIPSAFAAAASLQMLLEISHDAYQRICDLADQAVKTALERGLPLKTPADPDQRGPLVVLQCRDAGQLVTRLRDAGIIASSRDNGLRISFHFYNRADDVERTFEAIEQHRHLLLSH